MGLCHFPNNPGLFRVTVVVPILGCLVLIPFCKSFPFTWACDGHMSMSCQEAAGCTCLCSWKSCPCQTCVSVAPAPVPPSLQMLVHFQRETLNVLVLSRTRLLSPALRESGANPAPPGFPPYRPQLKRTIGCSGWLLRTRPSPLQCPVENCCPVL